MIIKEARLEVHLESPIDLNKEKYIFGYFLTIDDLLKLLNDYLSDRENDNMLGHEIYFQPYIEGWLKKHERIVK